MYNMKSLYQMAARTQWYLIIRKLNQTYVLLHVGYTYISLFYFLASTVLLRTCLFIYCFYFVFSSLFIFSLLCVDLITVFLRKISLYFLFSSYADYYTSIYRQFYPFTPIIRLIFCHKHQSLQYSERQNSYLEKNRSAWPNIL